MIKRILTYPEDKDLLTQKSEPVLEINEDIKNTIQDLKDTLHASDGGVGISAIQIGIAKQICICSWGGKEIVLINPKITRSRGNQEFKEGCLSAPMKMKKVQRFQKVWCSYLNEYGEEKEVAEGGRMSNIIQHEMDHFEGNCALFKD